jgi:hypothetical protein
MDPQGVHGEAQRVPWEIILTLMALIEKSINSNCI